MGDTARIVSPEGVQLEPLYPATRLLKASDLECELLLSEARETLERAQAEREQILQQTETERQAILARSRSEADGNLAQGFEAGRREAQDQVAHLLETLELQTARLCDAYPEDVRRTAFQIARAVVKARFEQEPELVLQFVAEALAKARHRSGLTIHVHPHDLPLLEEGVAALATGLALDRTPCVVAADDVPRHGARIETDGGAAWHVALEDRFVLLERQVARALAEQEK